MADGLSQIVNNVFKSDNIHYKLRYLEENKFVKNHTTENCYYFHSHNVLVIRCDAIPALCERYDEIKEGRYYNCFILDDEIAEYLKLCTL